MFDTTPEPSAAGAPETGAARFDGADRAYWRLLVRGAVRLVLTLGIYRFWLTSDIRRFLWSNTEVAGESLEYTGTAIELLLGFLLAIAILVPLYIAFFLAAIELGIVGRLAGILGFVLLAFLGQYAVYRARRYRLTRTVFRGIRFQQTGSAWRYAVCALFWWTMIVLTLGLAYPWAQASLERFKMRHTSYGNLPGRFEGSALSLFWRGLPMWLLILGPFAACLGLAIAAVDWNGLAQAAARGQDFSANMEGVGLAEALGLLMLALSWIALAAALLYPAFQALTLRWWCSGLRFDAFAVTSNLRTGPVYRIYLRFLVYACLFAIAASIPALIGLQLIEWAPGKDATAARQILSAGLGVAFYATVALGYSTIYQATVKLSLWRLGVDSLELSGLAALDRAEAVGAPSSPVGEGLADALNVGGF